MTSAEFESRYQLLAEIAAGAVRTRMARDWQGVLVMAHFLGPVPGDGAAWLAALDRLPRDAQAVIRERCVVDGNAILITRMLDGFVDFPGWSQAHGGAPSAGSAAGATATPPPSAPQGPMASGAEPVPAPPRGGEFTQLFGPPKVGGAPPAPRPAADAAPTVPLPTVERSIPSAAPAEPPPSTPGEFTRAFGAPRVEAPPPAPKPEPPASTAPAPAPPPPAGDFTQLFGAAKATPPPAAPAPVRPPPEPETEKLPVMPAAGPAAPPPSVPTAPPPAGPRIVWKGAQQPGAPPTTPEVPAPVKPPQPPPPVPPPARPYVAEPSRPVAPPRPPQPPPAPPPQAPPAVPSYVIEPSRPVPPPRPASPPPQPPPPAAAPGEFTQLFGAPGTGAPPPPRPAAPRPEPPEQVRRDYRAALDGLHPPAGSAPPPPVPPPSRPQVTERPAPGAPGPAGFTQIVAGRAQARLGGPATDSALDQTSVATPGTGVPKWLVVSLAVIGVATVALIVALVLI